jgi:MbtH protein
MPNPFDDENGTYLVLVNAEDQHSLWPAAIQPPAGWTPAHGPTGRADCVDFVDTSWTDMRPRTHSFGEATDGPQEAR